ncbi:ubiquitin conjugation factor E4 [Podospora conica]|nr:ubiquitin conjugation factor E4 [Schizothecium conicum]
MDPHEQPPPAATPDAPDQETMEQIRRRRLERLGGPPSSTTTPKPESTESESASTPAPSPAPDKVDKGKAKAHSSAAPWAAFTVSPAPKQQQQQQSPATGSVATKRKREMSQVDSAPATPPPRKNVPPKEESIDDYTDRVLCSLFRVTLDPSRETDSSGHKLTFLPTLSQELAEENAPLKLSVDRLEEAIVEAAAAFPHHLPLLNYLLPCWKRVTKSLKLLRGPAPQKEEVLKEAKRLCFSNCIFAISVPELFSREPNPQYDSLMPYLLREVDSEHGLCMDFLDEAMSRIDDDDTILPLFTKAMVDISAQLGRMSMNDSYKPSVNALLTYSRYPPLLNALAEDPLFQIAVSAPGIEKSTILGPFFRISPLQPDVTTVYFAGPRTMDQARIRSSQSALQMTLNTHQTDLRTIINAFVRAGPRAKTKVLDWFAYIMNVNHKRRAMQVDNREVSSDGFMMNVTVILDYLCEPFMDSTFSKIGRIDVDYFRKKPRLDIKEETKLNADQARSDAFYANQLSGEPNFITEIFFLTLAAHHYGSEATNAKMKNLDKDIKFYNKNLVAMEAERIRLADRPDQLRQLDAALVKYTAVLEKAMSLRFSIEGVLLDDKMQARSLQFMRYVTVWLLRVASQSEYSPDKVLQLQLPLPAEQPEAFRCLPEYVLQDVVDNFKFAFRYVPRVVMSAVGEELVALSVTFLESSEYIKNPYLKSALVSLLFHGTFPTYHLKNGVLGDIMTSTKFANDHLLHAVMKFYIECESTGASSQFYDKFNIRYEIFHIIKAIWTNDVYKQQLTQSSKTNRGFFVQFVNLLMNDATYVLDEGLGKFPKIHDLQMKLRDPSLADQDREKLEEELQTTEGQAASFMQLANETVGMMKLFTNTLGDAFTMPEIVGRLAAMLDFNLSVLTGPKSKKLKVDNPEKYFFNPKALLPELVDIYLNLGTNRQFIEAVASDGRSYNPEMMQTTLDILKSRDLKDPHELVAWSTLCAKFVQARAEIEQLELDLSDAPPEFEDEIMGDLMKDPVILPSRHILDRSTIVQHLLSDPKDPYTRQPMTIEDVVPDVELKARIDAWKESKRAAALAAKSDAMDTTA